MRHPNNKQTSEQTKTKIVDILCSSQLLTMTDVALNYFGDGFQMRFCPSVQCQPIHGRFFASKLLDKAAIRAQQMRLSSRIKMIVRQQCHVRRLAQQQRLEFCKNCVAQRCTGVCPDQHTSHSKSNSNHKRLFVAIKSIPMRRSLSVQLFNYQFIVKGV